MVEAAEPLLAAAALRDRMRSDLDRAQADARRDRLTGLANRLAWDEAIAATTQSNETPAAVVMVDGGGLKAINDTYGHQVGDELLCAIAAALNSCVRVGDVVARLGGDEFALLLADADESCDRRDREPNRVHDLGRETVERSWDLCRDRIRVRARRRPGHDSAHR